MADLKFEQVIPYPGSQQTWKAEADHVEWLIRCQFVDADGIGNNCTFWKKTDLDTGFRAMLGSMIRLEDAKRAVNDLNEEEVLNGPLRRRVLRQLQQNGMPVLSIAHVERAFQAVAQGKTQFSSLDEKRVAQALQSEANESKSAK